MNTVAADPTALRRTSHPARPGMPIPPPDLHLTRGNYSVRFARSAAELDAICSLRFDVFNLELREGLAESYATARDRDRFDDQCHHLLVEYRPDRSVVGTYRMQLAEMAAAGAGFYSDEEFDLSVVDDATRARMIELGRACIARGHRSRQVLYLLWCGLMGYLRHFDRRFLFGCSSITSIDPARGASAWRELRRLRMVREDIHVPVRADYLCIARPGEREPRPDLPQLMLAYLRHGAQICSPPALDRRFGTIDFLTVFDVLAADPTAWQRFDPGR